MFSTMGFQFSEVFSECVAYQGGTIPLSLPRGLIGGSQGQSEWFPYVEYVPHYTPQSFPTLRPTAKPKTSNYSEHANSMEFQHNQIEGHRKRPQPNSFAFLDSDHSIANYGYVIASERSVGEG